MGSKKNRKNVVFSTNPNYGYDYDEDEDKETLEPSDQYLRVIIDRKQRKGKTATIIEGFEGNEDDLKALGKTLKQKCGSGGSARDGEILIQGEVRDKVVSLLQDMGYNVKKVGG